MPSDHVINRITVEVAYATPEKQRIISLQVEQGTTAKAAVLQSGILDEFPEINVEQQPMGIFSKPLNGKGRALPDAYILESGDRVEIYRPLQIDPKQARLERAKDKASAKQK
jgi:putative ubiquitin-RnfH superfamily antitoxin RatB of RatAB toxin-antitoxin module